MPRKKKISDKETAIQIAVHHVIVEVNKRGMKPFAAAFAVKTEDDVAMLDLAGIMPTPDHLESTIKKGFKTGANFVIVTLVNPLSEEDNIIISIYGKDLQADMRISPYRIVNDKLVPVARQEKGFSVFLED